MPARTHAVIIGAGIVGVTTALALQNKGFSVKILAPGGPGNGASAGNPGALSKSSILPAAMPGVHKKVASWLLNPMGPLSMRWLHLPFMAPWLIQFLRNAQPRTMAASMAALARLTDRAREAYQPLLTQAGATHLVSDRGHLLVYRSRTHFDAETESWERRAGLGIACTSLAADEVRALEPNLDPHYRFGRLVPGNSHIADPLELVRLLARSVIARGGQVLDEAATGFAIEDGRIVGVRTDKETHRADRVVVAAGSGSAKLAAMLGDKVLLEAERGYNVTIAEPGFTLARPVFSTEAKLMAASMTGGLRLAGTAEFSGHDTPPDWRRSAALRTLGGALFPALRDIPEGEATRWAGYRPSTPDSLPVIGPAGKIANIYYAFGHGHLGMTTAAVTAEIVAALAAGEATPIAIDAFSPSRFARQATR